MKTHPPGWFERLLRRAGEGTSVGDSAAGDLRREWQAWRAAHGRWRADARYAFEALRIALRLHVSRWRGGRSRYGEGPRGRTWATWSYDLRYGARALLRSPAFTLGAAFTFALGIGATTAIFAAVRGVLLEPLPYPDADRLYTIEVNTGGEGWYGSSIPEFLDYETSIDAFEAVGGWSSGDVTVGDSLAPVRVRAAFASASLLPLLGVQPAMGRFFTPEEETPSDNRYVVLDHALWHDAYGADRELIGATVPLFGVDYVVVGVMPEGFVFPDPAVRAWFPFGMNRADPPPRNNHFLRVVGRLHPGVTAERAADQLAAYAAGARADFPEIYSERGFRARLQSLHDSVVGDVRSPLTLLMLAVALILVIASVNVASLYVSRGESRRRELAVRASLGATRGRIVRQLVTESMLLASAGGVAGIGIASIAVGAIRRLAPPAMPRVDLIRMGAEPLALALLFTLLAGVLFGIATALRLLRHGGDEGIVRAGRGVVARRAGRRVRRGLVVVQVALASVVVMGAGLMMRTLAQLRSVDPGFRAAGAVTLTISPSFARYAQPEARVAIWDRLTESVAGIPGVTAVGATSALPLTDQYDNLSIRVEGRVTTSIGDAPDGRVQRVTPGLFEALGLRLVAGRTFTAADRADAHPVVVVSETFARQFWPGQDPLGKRMRVFAEGYPWLEVVGVVADVAHARLDLAAAPMWYVPLAQAQNAYGTPLQLYAVVRTAGDPAAVVPAVRAAVASVDPTAPVSRVRLLEDLLGESLAVRSFTLDLLRAFAFVALFLAFIGVYGVAMLSVAERRAEIGLRRTLGAGRRSIARLVAGEALVTVAIGAGAGLVAAVAAARFIEALLYGVGTADALTLAATALLLGVTALIAAFVPTWRALRIEPLTSLRAGE